MKRTLTCIRKIHPQRCTSVRMTANEKPTTTIHWLVKKPNDIQANSMSKHSKSGYKPYTTKLGIRKGFGGIPQVD